MLEVIKFSDGRFGVRNTWTGVYLRNDDGEILSWKYSRSALRYSRVLTRRFNRTFRSLSKTV